MRHPDGQGFRQFDQGPDSGTVIGKIQRRHAKTIGLYDRTIVRDGHDLVAGHGRPDHGKVILAANPVGYHDDPSQGLLACEIGGS